MITVSYYGDRTGRLILMRQYRSLKFARRTARSWARWGVLHCGSAHGFERGHGYTRWDKDGRTYYDSHATGRRALSRREQAVRKVQGQGCTLYKAAGE